MVRSDPSTNSEPASPKEEWVTTTQAADETGRNIETIRRWIRHGRLEARTLPGRGKPQQVRRSDLLDLLADDNTPVRPSGQGEHSGVYPPASRLVLDEEPTDA
jgi:hypothetical protein